MHGEAGSDAQGQCQQHRVHHKDCQQSCQDEDRVVGKDNNRDHLISKVFLAGKKSFM